MCVLVFAARPTAIPTVKPVTVTPRPTGWPTPNPTRMLRKQNEQKYVLQRLNE